ncbi:hypothetical protein F511_38367 [Dorcoceras hygrometricum]|uniref:Uncharacterized protein n=1 Tax=Dorcoceras hygrometricum TaxID=472368 RepID=A0A2Z7A2C3_9LAMI|nr:hypothetical protein F511_38367 [Dorcoceras hygrometricum]
MKGAAKTHRLSKGFTTDSAVYHQIIKQWPHCMWKYGSYPFVPHALPAAPSFVAQPNLCHFTHQMSTLVNGTVAGDRWIERAGFVVLNARVRSFWEKPVPCFPPVSVNFWRAGSDLSKDVEYLVQIIVAGTFCLALTKPGESWLLAVSSAVPFCEICEVEFVELRLLGIHRRSTKKKLGEAQAIGTKNI